jgi:hypothetical protein
MSLMSRLFSIAKREEIDMAAVPNEPLREIDNDGHCGCVLPDGCRGQQGWHFREVSSFDEAFDDETLDPQAYSGRQLAYERCPAYWGSMGCEIDGMKVKGGESVGEKRIAG